MCGQRGDRIDTAVGAFWNPRPGCLTRISSMGSVCSWTRAGFPRSTAPASMSVSRRWRPPSRRAAPSSRTSSKAQPAEATTAFGLRRDHVLVEILAAFVDRSDKEEEQRHHQWARTTRQAFAPMAFPGGYPNFLSGDDDDRVAQSYGPNAERLIKAKRYYDPDNVFSSTIPLPIGID
jgi:hypothetical protein